MDDVIIARALHVLGVVVWIGGVAMVTMVVLPALRRGDLGPDRLQVFEAIERRFGWHARLATLIVGLTGFYMTQRLDFWDRFRSGGFWWMHAMVCLWLLFTLLLFVAEPLVLHRRFHARALAAPDAAFALLQRAGVDTYGHRTATFLRESEAGNSIDCSQGSGHDAGSRPDRLAR
jgi:uncharacterized membrane protein